MDTEGVGDFSLRAAFEFTSWTAAKRRATRSPARQLHAAMSHRKTDPLPFAYSENATPSATCNEPDGARGSGRMALSLLAATAICRTSLGALLSPETLSHPEPQVVDTPSSDEVSLARCQEVWNPPEG